MVKRIELTAEELNERILTDMLHGSLERRLNLLFTVQLLFIEKHLTSDELNERSIDSLLEQTYHTQKEKLKLNNEDFSLLIGMTCSVLTYIESERVISRLKELSEDEMKYSVSALSALLDRKVQLDDDMEPHIKKELTAEEKKFLLGFVNTKEDNLRSRVLYYIGVFRINEGSRYYFRDYFNESKDMKKNIIKSLIRLNDIETIDEMILLYKNEKDFSRRKEILRALIQISLDDVIDHLDEIISDSSFGEKAGVIGEILSIDKESLLRKLMIKYFVEAKPDTKIILLKSIANSESKKEYIDLENIILKQHNSNFAVSSMIAFTLRELNDLKRIDDIEEIKEHFSITEINEFKRVIEKYEELKNYFVVDKDFLLDSYYLFIMKNISNSEVPINFENFSNYLLDYIIHQFNLDDPYENLLHTHKMIELFRIFHIEVTFEKYRAYLTKIHNGKKTRLGHINLRGKYEIIFKTINRLIEEESLKVIHVRSKNSSGYLLTRLESQLDLPDKLEIIETFDDRRINFS